MGTFQSIFHERLISSHESASHEAALFEIVSSPHQASSREKCITHNGSKQQWDNYEHWGPTGLQYVVCRAGEVFSVHEIVSIVIVFATVQQHATT
jgi:hypothetical protein